VLLETHVLDWPATLGTEGGYGRRVRVELLHWLHEERRYASLDTLRDGIAADTAAAAAWWQRYDSAA
jgi:riboflavin kinase / FMN adenylyltransferase